MSHRPLLRASTAGLIGAALVATSLLVVAVAGPAAADVPSTPSPIAAPSATAVTATALPTAQIDGIVWAQVVHGDTVYAGGEFDSARPAGVAAGGAGEVPRNNLMSYDITTGVMTDFAPDIEGSVQALALSPDGSRLYVGGHFTVIDGQNRYRLAAFDTATGALVQGFVPTPDYIVNAIVATADTVYVGGAFTHVGGVDRNYLAAFTTGGQLLGWNPLVDREVRALALTGDAARLVVGGRFGTINGVEARGLGSVDPQSGATQDFPANKVVYGYGNASSFFSLAVQGDTVYGTAYKYKGAGNLEGAFAADAATGELTWVEDCHGDSYSVFPTPDQVYVVGHPHFCGNIGGYPQQNPPQRALAFTTAATGTVQPNTQGTYPSLDGNPSPSLTTWFPTLTPGQVSGALQAAWSVTGDSRYVVLGGEFPTVNGVAQQGLTRFATPSVAADAIGPDLSGDTWLPRGTSLGQGSLRISIRVNHDRDDYRLDYTLQRDTGEGTDVSTVWQTSANSVYWLNPQLAVADTGLTPGVSYRYRMIATDAAGNQAVGGWRVIKAPNRGSAGANTAPTAVISSTVGSDGLLTVDGTGSTDSDGQVSRYRWDFGDGTYADTATATHRYPVSGTYRVTLTVTDDDAATGTASTDVTVVNAATAGGPTARFTSSTDGTTLRVDGSGSSTSSGRITQYRWGFGDGKAAGGATPSHEYARAGTYRVRLEVTDTRGRTSVATAMLTVRT